MDHLEAAVKRCWASLWSERAVSYRRAGGLAIDRSAIAVVVQQLVRSDVSFVIFTADPVSGDASRVVISASWGLGEAIVSGLVTPDHIVVGPDGDVLEYAIGEKHLMIVPAPDGGQGTVELRVPSGLRRMPVLSHEQASQIAESARTLSGQLGFAADLEGGICEGVTYFFQARPITTLGDGHR
jgi:pyruvate,water dikinase